MKYYSLKFLILCIALPPLFYTVSLGVIESGLQRRYSTEIEEIYIGDPKPLLQGTAHLNGWITENIDRFLNEKRILAWGVDVTVTVVTHKGRLLYPNTFESEKEELINEDPMQTAADNFRLMNEGLRLIVSLKIGHNTPLANSLLAFYIAVALLALYVHYRSGMKRVRADHAENTLKIERLSQLETDHREKLNHLNRDKDRLTDELFSLRKRLEDEKTKASQNEEELIDDIVSLEKKIDINVTLQEEQQREITLLKEKIKGYEKGKKHKKSATSTKKRFRTLYKNLTVNDRAIDGFNDLTEDLKIKCEEIIHQLNHDPGMVTIKRKVFGKKNRETVLEVLFAYKGRLYFRKLPDMRIEILAVGTKNTQTRELGFLDSL